MQYVRVGRRFVAIFIDSLVIGAIVAPFTPVIDVVHRSGYYHFHIGGHHLFWPGLAAIVYFTLFEGITGATLGKFLLGIRVVNEDGSKVTWSNSIVRNVSRLVDEFPYFIPYLVGAIAVWNSPTRQRLGDRWAHTVVVTHASLMARGSVTYPIGARQPSPPAAPGPPVEGSPPLPPPPPAAP
jgi:uncharacterized RDD family membrane protein YckC